jgi:hypothetical protein
MRIEIDQSGKVEDTSCKTVIALSNQIKHALVVSAREKRKLQEFFRIIGKPRMFVDVSFAVLVSLVIKKSVGIGKKIIVDMEYEGHSRVIETIINGGEEMADIRWEKIGKNSKAHDLAYKVYAGKRKADEAIRAEQIWKLAKKKTGGCLNSGLKPENRHSAPVLKSNLTKKRYKVKR